MKTLKVSIWVEVADDVTPQQVMEALPPMPLKGLSPIFANSMHGSVRIREVDTDDFDQSLSLEAKKCFSQHAAKMEEVKKAEEVKKFAVRVTSEAK